MTRSPFALAAATAAASAALAVAGCATIVIEPSEPDVAPGYDEVLAADRAFSARSLEVGAPQAFEEFFAEDGVVLPTSGGPRRGLDALAAYMADFPADARLSWEPAGGDISEGGDLGYTWGRYRLIAPDGNGGEQAITGHYTTIWERQADGDWRVVLDIGNR